MLNFKHLADDTLARAVAAAKESTPLERELAMRLIKHQYALDEMERDFIGTLAGLNSGRVH